MRYVSKLCRRLRTTDGVVAVGGLLDLPAGATRLLNAPTGIGKGVVMELVACWMAAHGLVVSIVVPTNTDVLRLTPRRGAGSGGAGRDGVGHAYTGTEITVPRTASGVNGRSLC